MNDLRSQNRTLTPVPEIGPQTGEILTSPTSRRSRSRANPLFESSRPAEDVERPDGGEAGRPALERPVTPVGSPAEAIGDRVPRPATNDSEAEPLPFPTSRGLRTRPATARPADEPRGAADVAPVEDRIEARADIISRRDGEEQAPASRPSKRREVAEGVEPEDDKFPWHHQFEDDEPEELQAKTPLLSRAFRSSVG